MDLIIELIVWIFKALAGEDGKNKSGTKGGAAAPPPTKRGPYNYGDGKSSTTGKPRTLEEILEEVKRQQAQGKAGAQKPSAQRAAAPVATPAKAKAPSLSRPLSEVQQPTAARAAAPAPLPSQGGSIQSTIERRELKQTLDQRELVKPGLEKKFEKISEREDQRALGIGHTKMVAQVDTVTTMGEVQSVSSMESNLADKRTNTFADFFKAIRIAPMKSRSEMARRAFVFSEVFGPPRCRGRHRR